MKKIVLLLICVLCVGCSAINRVVVQRKSPDQKVAYLTGKTQYQIQQIMGMPIMDRTEGSHQMWAYRTGECSTLIYFDTTKKSSFVDMRGECSRSVADARNS